MRVSEIRVKRIRVKQGLGVSNLFALKFTSYFKIDLQASVVLS